MALSENRIVYGIHSMAPYSRSTYQAYGILKVIGGGSLSMTAEFEDLFGGSNKFAWASEAKTIASEFTATVKSMPDFLFEVYLGASVSTTAASATGTAGTIANKKGTSAVAATGILSVGVKAGSEADLKSGLYAVVVASATTVDVYALTDIDFLEGTDLTYQDDTLKITATALTITTDTAVEIPSLGAELTGGAGTIAMTVGDVAFFSLAKAHAGISEITIGQAATTFPEHGFLALAQKRANGDLIEIEVFKAAGAGFPMSFEETVFAIPELTIKLLYDETADAIAKVRAIKGA
jgi:hypothetical protein